MRARKVALISVVGVASIIGVAAGAYAYLQASYQRQTKNRLLAQARDEAATSARVAALRPDADEGWSDGGVGVTGDGYVFYYRLHNSHGMDLIADTNILYLPDEQRFIVDHQHFCVDLRKARQQPKNKAALLALFTAGHDSIR